MIQKHSVLLLLCIVLFGFVLRLHDYSQWPREGATFDEYAWTWLGMNIIQKGVPISWSPHPQYKIRTHYIQRGARFWLVQPYLEHPPLFGLVAGGYALLRGTSDMYHVRLAVIRELAIIMGVVSIVLVYLLARSLYDDKVGLLSAFFYAITPTVVVGSRLVQNENFFIPMFLGILFLIHRYIKTGKRRFFVFSAILAGLAVLAKVPWIAAGLACVLFLMYNRKWKASALFALTVFAMGSLYVGYGFFWDKDVFLSLMKLQMNRYDLVFDSVYALFTQPYLIDRYWLDGWIFVGWGALLLVFIEGLKKHAVLLLGFTSYLAVFVFAIPNQPEHGWYRYPFYPFLIIGLAFMLKKYFNSNYLLSALFIMFVGLSMLQHTWFPSFGFSFAAHRVFLICAGLGAMPAILPYPLIMKFSRRVNVSVLILILLTTVWAVLGYTEQ